MSLFELLEKIRATENGEVSLEIPEERFNLLMLRILQAKAKAENKSINFQATGPRGKRLLAALTGFLQEGESRQSEVAEGGPVRVAKSPASIRKWRRVAVIVSAVLGVFLLLGGVAYGTLYYLPKAEVVLTLNPIPLVKEIAVGADTAVTSVSAEAGLVPGVLRTVEESGTKSAPATGTATVGEKARGTITFNSTIANSCVQGTKVKEDSSGLVFVTDSGFTIGAIETKDISVTAERIGSNYNLTSGKHFSVTSGCSNNTAMEGNNPADFTGGSSQQVTVVAAADQDKLLTDLQKELVERAKETIKGQSGIDEVVVDDAIKTEVVEKNYSHSVGEQAENVSLDLKVRLTTITYRGSDIQSLVSQSLATLVPSGFTLFPGETRIEPLDPKLGTTKLTFRAKISAQVVPEIDQEKIKTDLVGRNTESALTYLGSLADVNAYELKLWPKLPGGLQRVPRSTKRITVTLVTEETSR